MMRIPAQGTLIYLLLIATAKKEKKKNSKTQCLTAINMEKTIHITNLKNLKYFQQNQYQRIYWGVEFCENLIRSLKDTALILKFSRKNNLAFSFITPFITNYGLERLKPVFTLFKQEKINIQIKDIRERF